MNILNPHNNNKLNMNRSLFDNVLDDYSSTSSLSGSSEKRSDFEVSNVLENIIMENRRMENCYDDTGMYNEICDDEIMFSASHDIIDESHRLYKYHLRREALLSGFSVPEYVIHGRYPEHMNALIELADRFRASPQRLWVHDQAQNVDLESLNFQSFQDLLDGLFQEGGVTYERVLVLFFFCTDLTIRAFSEKLLEYFHRINQWITSYIGNRLSLWIEEQGGWGAVLHHSVTTVTKYAFMTFCCLGIIALAIYIKSKHHSSV
ncbi:uncharacterized protein [Onthophagus taurus]|uniref:uncharacterized protein n=1 Tax=Onthophagus taurus TaxID=166361 RepID=UPI000C20DA39|nr:uncharacterized protein LOC111429176 [Onthophagus taurus]